jgi:tetratricopeptide (TPR) repeat protein
VIDIISSDKAYEWHFDISRAYYNRGLAYYKIEDYAKAKKDFEKAKRYPNTEIENILKSY